MQDTNIQHFPRKRPSKNDLRRPFIPLFAVSKLSSPQFPQSRMYRQKSYRQACSVKRPHVSERFIHVEGPRNVSSTVSRLPCSRWQDVRSGDCAKPVSQQFSTALLEDGGNLGWRESGGKFRRNLLPSPRSLSFTGWKLSWWWDFTSSAC